LPKYIFTLRIISTLQNKVHQISWETIFSSRKKHGTLKKCSLEFRSQRVIDKGKKNSFPFAEIFHLKGL